MLRGDTGILVETRRLTGWRGSRSEAERVGMGMAMRRRWSQESQVVLGSRSSRTQTVGVVGRVDRGTPFTGLCLQLEPQGRFVFP